MAQQPEQSGPTPEHVALVEHFNSYTGVDRWFRMELAVGLGAAYEQSLLYSAQNGTEISHEEYSEVFYHGADWAVDRGRYRFEDNPSKIAELESTIWKLFSSKEQVGLMFERFCAGKFHYYVGDSRETMGVYLVGDNTMFVFTEPESEAKRAA